MSRALPIRLRNTFFFKTLHLFACARTCTCMCTWTRRQCRSPLLPSHGSWVFRVVRLGSRSHYPVGHLAGPETPLPTFVLEKGGITFYHSPLLLPAIPTTLILGPLPYFISCVFYNPLRLVNTAHYCIECRAI